MLLCALAAALTAAALAAAPPAAHAGAGDAPAPGGAWTENGMQGAHAGLGEGAEVLDWRWTIIDAAVVASLDKEGRERILAVAGSTDRPGEPILVTVRAPDGSIVSGSSAAADPDGSFLVELPVEGLEWAADGAYAVTLFQAAGRGEDPHADTVLVRMSGGSLQAGGAPGAPGAPLPPGAPAGYEDPTVIGAAWTMLEKAIIVPGGGPGGGDILRLVAVPHGAGEGGGGGPDAPARATVRIAAPTGLEIGRLDMDTAGAGNALVATIETDGSRWAQDGTYLVSVHAEPPPGGAASLAAGGPSPRPDVLPLDVFDGSIVVAPSARAAAASPDGREGPDAAAPPPIRQWDLIDAIVVLDSGGAGQLVVIAGSTDRPGVPVHLRASDPAGRVIRDAPLMPDRETGAFLVDFNATGPAWSDSGAYRIELEQRSRTGQVYYGDLAEIEAGDGGEVAPVPWLGGTMTPASVTAAYGSSAELVAVEWAVIKEVRISAAAPEGPYTEVLITGRTANADAPLSITLAAPGGLNASRIEAEPLADGSFEAAMSASGPPWSADGAHAIIVEQAGGPPFADVVLLELRGGGIVVGLAPDDVDIVAAAALGDGGRAPAPAPAPAPERTIFLGERWDIIDALVLAKGTDGRQVLVVVGTTDLAGLPVQATVDPPGGSPSVAFGEAAPDPQGVVLVEVPVDPAGWGGDGAYLLTVSQPGTRYADMYPVYLSGGLVDTSPEFDGLPVPPPASGYDSARLLDLKWGLVDRAEVETAADGSSPVVAIYGTTDRPKIPVTVGMEDPGGSPVRGLRIAPNADGSFEVRIDASGEEWAADGTYRITVEQGPGSIYTDLVLVDVADGVVVPEFGMLAPLALAVAVAAAVAAAARFGPAGLRPVAAAGMR